jgi:hypothetical protein
MNTDWIISRHGSTADNSELIIASAMQQFAYLFQQLSHKQYVIYIFVIQYHNRYMLRPSIGYQVYHAYFMSTVFNKSA